jgi:uncharacterized protein (TIGR00251 family)
MILKVKVKANSYQSKIVKKEGDFLVIHVKLPREKGLANKALIEILSKEFSTPKTAIKIQSGLTSIKKTIIIEEVYANFVFERLSCFL